MQHLKTYFLTAVLTALCLISARAQEPVESSESPAPRREIGFGTNIILGPVFNSGSSPLHLMYRWGDQQRLYRLGTSQLYSSNTSHSSDLLHKYWYGTYSSELFFGKEWRKEITERWLVNFGGDINFSYYQHFSQSENTGQVNQDNAWLRRQERKTQKLGTGIRPFAGILFRINDRLLLGTEASFWAILQRETILEERYTLVNEVRDAQQDFYVEESSWVFNARTQPASNIFVYYRF